MTKFNHSNKQHDPSYLIYLCYKSNQNDLSIINNENNLDNIYY